MRAGESPVDRVLARSESKPRAAVEIFAAEAAKLGDRLRALVLSDFAEAGGMVVPGRRTSAGSCAGSGGGAARTGNAARRSGVGRARPGAADRPAGGLRPGTATRLIGGCWPPSQGWT